MHYNHETMKELLACQAPNIFFVVCMLILGIMTIGLKSL
jgi:hypothetical protein